MPMFDDPKKELQRLQQQLLAEEENNEEEYLTEEEWLEREIAEAKALSGYQEPKEPKVRNYANGYGTRPQQPQYDPNRRSHLSGRSGYPQQERAAYRPNVQSYSEETIPEEEEKGIGGLVFLAILLTLGIVAVAGYWVLVLL